MEKEILIFGDSVVEGAYDYEFGGWATRLKLYVWNKYPEYYLPFYIEGISGNTTKDMLNRIDTEIKHRLFEEEYSERAIILAIGENDTSMDKTINKTLIPVEEFEDNLLELIELVKKYKFEVVFIGFGKVDESKTNPTTFDKNLFYKNEVYEQYDALLQMISKEKNCHYVELKRFKENYKDLLEDGVHPNTKGHKVIFEEVKDFLEKEKII